MNSISTLAWKRERGKECPQEKAANPSTDLAVLGEGVTTLVVPASCSEVCDLTTSRLARRGSEICTEDCFDRSLERLRKISAHSLVSPQELSIVSGLGLSESLCSAGALEKVSSGGGAPMVILAMTSFATRRWNSKENSPQAVGVASLVL